MNEDMNDDKRLTDEFVVHDYDTDDSAIQGAVREEVESVGGSDVLVDEAGEASRLVSALQSLSIRLRGAASETTADNALAHAAERAAASADALAQSIEKEGLRGIGDRAVGFVKSNSKAVAASAAGLGLIAVEAWRRGGRRSRR